MRLRVSGISAWTCSLPPNPQLSMTSSIPDRCCQEFGNLSPAPSQELRYLRGRDRLPTFLPHHNSELQSVIPGKYRQEVWCLHLPSHIYSIETCWTRQAKSTGTHYFHPSFLIKWRLSTRKASWGQRLPFLGCPSCESFWEKQALPLREVSHDLPRRWGQSH